MRGRAGHLIELKAPEMYNARGVDMEGMVLATLKRNGLDRLHADPKTPVIIQSFSAKSVQKLALQLKTRLALHLLVGAKDKDVWLTREGLEKVKSFSTGISPEKVTLTANPQIVTWAHDLGLLVTPYTFRVMPGADVKEVREEMSRHLSTLGVDGVITDNPDQMPRR
jgi:glycerophosphoryl diester phosphodiesterase